MLVIERASLVLLGVAAIAAPLYFRKRNRVDKSAGSAYTQKTIVDTADDRHHWAVDIRFPQNGADIRDNDLLISIAVKAASSKLYVFVHSHENTTPQELRVYMAALYNQLWDECCVAEQYTLDCIVVLPCVNQNFWSREDVLMKPELRALYGRDETGIGGINAERCRKGCAEVFFISPPAVSPVLSEGVLFLDDADVQVPTYPSVVLGGTFDHMHNGHKKILTLALSVCSKTLTVGVTSSSMLRKKKLAESIEPFEVRKKKLELFVKSISPTTKLVVEEINDPFGPTVTQPDFDAIVVSSETIAGGHKINQIREGRGLRKLAILVSRRSDASTLSSTFIRQQLYASREVPKSRFFSLFS